MIKIYASGQRIAGRAPRSLCKLFALCAMAIVLAALGACGDGSSNHSSKPNILFVIMDDVGMDQMTPFGYGGVAPQENSPISQARVPTLPNIQSIADAGIRFNNTWSMPACSTSRAVFFTGRFPLRTHVLGALGPSDLANAQVSPYETSLPKLLKQQGYRSAIFGKFHIGLPGTNPYKEAMPSSLGWDYFFGWLDETGDPSTIDTWAGTNNSSAKGPYSCGFVTSLAQDPVNGADHGACYTVDGGCRELAVSSDGVPPGRTCRDSGGLLAPRQSCQSPVPANIATGFQMLSAHYVSPLWIDKGDGQPEHLLPQSDARARTFRGSSVVDAAIGWINDRPKNEPWMASVSFASAHTPAMQPPQALLPTDPAATSRLSCATTSDDPLVQDALSLAQRELTTQMVDAIDAELARLLVSTGLASRNADGSLQYNPASNNTMIVIVGDNGSLGSAVKLPFDPGRAKGTAYQTGVWVPLIVAGPMVKQPDREVGSMVNIADLYQLFGEVAGIDVHASVPRKLDSMAMLPYLKNPAQASIRQSNFTQVGNNAQANGGLNAPCTISTSCTQIPVTKTVCEDNGGAWWGADGDAPITKGKPAEGFTYCCQVNKFLYDKATNPSNPDYDPSVQIYDLQPLSAAAVRNDSYKVVRNYFVGNPHARDDAAQSPSIPPSCDTTFNKDEFYSIDQAVPTPKIDKEDDDLLVQGLTPEQQTVYETLSAELDRVLNSEPPCPAGAAASGDYQSSIDGNLDGVVDNKDLDSFADFERLSNGGSSWYDINQDGNTDSADYDLIAPFLETKCSQR